MLDYRDRYKNLWLTKGPVEKISTVRRLAAGLLVENGNPRRGLGKPQLNRTVLIDLLFKYQNIYLLEGGKLGVAKRYTTPDHYDDSRTHIKSTLSGTAGAETYSGREYCSITMFCARGSGAEERG